MCAMSFWNTCNLKAPLVSQGSRSSERERPKMSGTRVTWYKFIVKEYATYYAGADIDLYQRR